MAEKSFYDIEYITENGNDSHYLNSIIKMTTRFISQMRIKRIQNLSFHLEVYEAYGPDPDQQDWTYESFTEEMKKLVNNDILSVRKNQNYWRKIIFNYNKQIEDSKIMRPFFKLVMNEFRVKDDSIRKPNEPGPPLTSTKWPKLGQNTGSEETKIENQQSKILFDEQNILKLYRKMNLGDGLNAKVINFFDLVK
jgi:hypothetical protein